MKGLLAFACVVLVGLSAGLWTRYAAQRRLEYIRHFPLPRGLYERLRQHHPALTPQQCELVGHGLRQFFLACARSGRRDVSMPSQVVDDLWHEFILYTRHYEAFCRRAFGRFLHHTPAVVLRKGQGGNAGLRRCWRHACAEENIHPRTPSRLPLLFALDAKLDIPGGFRYVADCSTVRREGERAGGGSSPYCGGDFASAEVDGSIDGFDDGSFGDGGGADGHGGGGHGGDGGGDGGGGDGGGCGGGGGD